MQNIMNRGESRLRFFIGCLAAVLVFAIGGMATADTYQTGFESPDFTLGPINSTGQQGWRLVEGTAAAIQNETVYTGAQALRIGAGSVVDKELTGLVSGNFLWIDAYAQVNLQDPLPDPTQLGVGSSLVHFSQSLGIACLNGNGNGGGTWVSTGVTPQNGTWVRITIRQNYLDRKWACYVNGVKTLENLGYKNNLTALSGFKSSAGDASSAFLDEFSVSTEAPDFTWDRPYINLFMFASVWNETDASMNETAYAYDYDANDTVETPDLLTLIDRILGN